MVRAFLSISRSSCRLLHPGGRPRPQGLVSRVEGWELGTQLIGGEVKQVLGLDSDRSSLTGVGLILREGFVLPAEPGGTVPTGGNSSKLLRFGGSESDSLGLPGLPEPLGFRPPAQGGLSPLAPSSGAPEPRPPRSRDGPGPGPRLRPARRARGASAAALRGSAAGKSWLRAPRPPRAGAPCLAGKAAEATGVLAGVEGPCGRTRLLCSLRKFSRNGTNSFRRGRSALRAATSELSSELGVLRAIHRTAAATGTSSRSSDSKTAAIPVQAL